MTPYIFVKEREGFSEKILKYVYYTYGRIFVPSQKQNFIIYACTIAVWIKSIERERYAPIRTIEIARKVRISKIKFVYWGKLSTQQKSIILDRLYKHVCEKATVIILGRTKTEN